MTRAEQIAGEYRRRIVSGRLRVGDAVPSTRAIMRDHGVAMATASRVLAILQDDGLVESTPGRGSVVRAPDGADPAVLTRDGVVGVAVRIADAESLSGVSMRRLAAALEIPTMAVYRYVPSRDDLELAMLDRVMGEIVLPPASGVWRADLEAAARALWQSMVQHPWFAGALSMTRPAAIPNAMVLSEAMLGSLHAATGDPVQSFTDYLCLLHLIRGVGLTLETELADRAATGLTNDEWMDTRIGDLRRVAPGERFPTMKKIIDTGYPYDPDVLFESGLRRFLDGVAASAGG
ncbi:GntR family transcriptional regulator [Gordonia sp. (in: high G+C Gram-positive bacteria)]|uniref:GntR family transcriptional regulator n=1 Tax=Gordonia sp. (in: high G+C Gram-positive bacteria) TaxID=84139 RepID=UPI0016BA1D83|nr:GntR family transcriptional regulator [Gordonia sp. (in: high G+C Gram-positive bacteria)]NLG46727.1 GntR family transcriptional regulator [Gordonia sp. (in: high G+C Gram-positive bacteria)]